MDEQIKQLGDLILVSLGITFFLACAVLVYLVSFWLGLPKEEPNRWPEVARDGQGRPLRERL